MKFRTGLPEDTPEINLIPLIDVLLVVLIFLAASTAFTRQAHIPLVLPQAHADVALPAQTLTLAISQDGLYALGSQWLPEPTLARITQALQLAAAQHENPTLIIHADAKSTHASVVLALHAARRAGITRISFATQSLP